MLPTIEIRKTMTSFVFLCFWLPSSVISGQIFSEVKAISGSPSADGEGRLMRLRTCHDVFMVQCEPCEVIHIVNASYAATRLQHRNPIHGCSDLTFQQEFDCLLSAKAQYFEAITRSCDGIQTCQFAREGSFVSCGHSSKTWSCCMEIYYTCEPKNYQIQTLHFSANDFYGNVNNVSLQCQSSDLFVESAVLVFNSSRETNKGDVCYKVIPDIKNLKRLCERRGCSSVSVHGDKGCGENENVFNHGLYVCYSCKDNKVHKSTRSTPFRQGLNSIEAGGITIQYSAATTDGKQTITSSQNKTAKRISSIIPSHEEATTTKLSPTTETTSIIAASSTVESSTTTEYITKSLTSEFSTNTTSSAEEINLHIKVELRLIVFDSFIGALLLFLFVGCIVYANRRNHRVLASNRLPRSQSRKVIEPDRGSLSSMEEQEDYSYPEMPPIYVQLKAGGKDQNYKLSRKTVDSDESRLQNEREYLDKVQAKQLVSTVCQVSPRVQEKLHAEETMKFDSKSNSNELTDYGTYLDFDADNAYEECVGKGLEPVYAEQQEFNKNLELIPDVTKESHPLCVNTDICREEPTTAYDTQDSSCMSPVYEELNHETMDEYPFNIGY